MLGKVISDYVWKKSPIDLFGSTAIEQHVCPSVPQREHIPSLKKMLEKSAKAADFPAEALEEEI